MQERIVDCKLVLTGRVLPHGVWQLSSDVRRPTASHRAEFLWDDKPENNKQQTGCRSPDLSWDIVYLMTMTWFLNCAIINGINLNCHSPVVQLGCVHSGKEYSAVKIPHGIFSPKSSEKTPYTPGVMGFLLWLHSLNKVFTLFLSYCFQYRVIFDMLRIYSIKKAKKHILM